ncbi:hypothetical protein FC62_GL000472 [Amylolactobacillus amylotrophicus DSM 20534]|uniref:RNase adaptor protein RapZ n=3 Tax=Amylolactobacillus TaxID=2767876 RepID=A0A1L6XDA7_9LACO|nr:MULTISPECIES: RNase adapter RapZ [Amylolactobacillus]APT18960.1 RNase adaptor protein RapZ [Amylolactobacillus amylophilus DSM 20533 = JCM 1125]KRK38780.1 hypothetical protein FC62_GL000472 [Amylolactobacillus amylotrophicus DSM 20534]KRM42577.1 hypothetical protein FD40_GL000368 [Amylolactobacillus amylophilus DSM 20533 = JCM 1125]GED80001.1 nucleotide-binding protein [Amylolactobacillus amylophilus]
MTETTKKLLIVTGMSGAGKTVAIQSLEDMGYFVVDNLPPALLPHFWELIITTKDISRVAVVIDLRVKGFYEDLQDEINSLEDTKKVHTNIVFLDAANDELVTRYKETRRAHPLAQNGRLLDAINQERALVEPIKKMAQLVIDTTNMSAAELKADLKAKFTDEQTTVFSIEVMSFGFKYGLPIDADIVMDVRFLPNPYYLPELRPFTGLDRRVSDYVMHQPATEDFYQKFLSLLETTIPGYIEEGKANLTIAIGCTGGQHRSVALAQRLAHDLDQDYKVDVTHREIWRYKGGSK